MNTTLELEKIPFALCQVIEDSERVRVYYLGKEVLHDYNDVANYLSTAIVLFRQIRKKDADWANLHNLWILRNCIRENYNHGLEVDALIYGDGFDREHIDTLTPLTHERFNRMVKVIKDKDPYASI